MTYSCTGTSSWWPILYIRNFLMALSLHITPNVDLFSISTTSPWPSFYTSDFLWPVLFIYFSFVSLYLRDWYIMFSCARTCGEIFCTHTSSGWPNLIIKTVWWLIQYTNLFMNFFFHRYKVLYPLVCIFVTFLASFVYLILLGGLMFTWNCFEAT